MSNKLYEENDIQNIANAIRNKNGTEDTYKVSQMSTAINSIEVIEQETAEGESLSLVNTKAMPYKNYVVEGKSEQTTRSGKNLANDNDMLQGYWAYADGGFVYSNTWICTPKIACKGNVDYTFQFANNSRWYGFVWYDENNNFISTANQQNNLQTGFRSFTAKSPSNAGYLAINIAGYPGTNDTISTDDLIDFQLKESSTVTDYEPYGASPSPDYPSEIHSVADDVNLLNLENIENHSVNSYYYENIGTNFQLKAGETYTISFDAESDITPFNVGIGCGSSGNYQSDILVKDGFQNGRISITFTPQNSNFTYGNYLALRFVKYNNPTSYTYSARNIKLQKGTVTIKQENMKNYLNWDKFIDYSNWTNSNSPGYKSFEITGLDINKTYTLCRTDTAGYGETSKYAGFNKGNNNGNMFLHSTDSSRNLQSVSDISSGDGKIYITMYMSSQSDLNAYINIIKKCWVIEDTEYQEYVNNNYTIQTEPLRSLPNGVKDTIEEEQHRKIGKQTGTLTETTTITLSDAKTNGAYMCNIKPSGTLTGKTIELEAGDYEIIYELEEEVIEPLTQNQATTMLDIIKTGSYEGTTNIYTDEDVKPTIEVGYYKKK